MDAFISSFVLQHRYEWLIHFMELFTRVGDGVVVLSLAALCGVMLAWKLKKFEFLPFLVLLTSSTYGVVLFLKELVARPRPNGEILTLTLGYSFPSGHAALTIFYLLLACVLVKLTKRRFVRGIIWFCAAAVAILIGVSRVYLGLHWFSDVLAGWVIAGVGAFVANKFFLPIHNHPLAVSKGRLRG